MAADAWVLHDTYKEYEGDGTIDVDNDTFVVRLYSSSSNVATTSITDASTVTNELSTANGYTNGGSTVAVTWTQPTAGTVMFDCANPQWTASGGSITARYAAIVDTTTTPDTLVAHCLLDNTPADVTATDGNTFTITINANGVFRKS